MNKLKAFFNLFISIGIIRPAAGDIVVPSFLTCDNVVVASFLAVDNVVTTSFLTCDNVVVSSFICED